MYKALYDSPLWLPILPCAVALAMLLHAALRMSGQNRTVRAYAVFFAVMAAADGWLGGAWTPLPAAGALTTTSVVFFVILGDFRYFLATRLGVLTLRVALVRALLLAFLVPVATQLLVRVPFPNLGPNALFLAYELTFLAVIVADHVRAPRTAQSRALLRFECVQYALWATADVLILSDVTPGYLLRIVPNVMYYAAFVPFAVRVLQRARPSGAVLTPLAAALLMLGCSRPDALPPGVSLRFLVDGQEVRSLELAALIRSAPAVTVASDDPYYGKTKHFRAMPLDAVLAAGFGDAPHDGREYVFRAKDGYAVPLTEAVVKERGAYLAFADTDVAGFEPIGAQHVSPFPLYLIWTEPTQKDSEAHPRPWQVESIERVRFDVAYPHLAPPAQARGEDTERARRGLATYRAQCFKCHAINREGGRIGPELNVPKNVFEYLPVEFIRAYIRKPSDFRYGIMPSHETMPAAELDDLTFYLRAMKDAKFDPK